MTMELLYTSAPRGLKQGSRGFCTVLSTEGMPVNVATRLEGLSAYRHAYPPGSEEATKNPVLFSHLKCIVGGQPMSILSRIADYGFDYSQRTNKIAHHVVLKPQELPQAGPAWAMLRSGIMRTDWDGECKTPLSGPNLQNQSQSSRVATAWKQITGDAGWAGVVAEAFQDRSPKPLWIIFSVEQSPRLLEMIDEAVALLPSAARSNATFCTYTTKLPPDVECKVRCVLQGTDEARLAPARGQVIDCTQALSPAPMNQWTQSARNGIVPSQQQEVQPAPAAVPVPPKQSEEPSASTPARTIESPASQSAAVASQVELHVAPPDIPIPPKRGRTARPATTSPGSEAKEDTSNRWLLPLGIAAALVLIALGAFAGVLATRGTQVAAAGPFNKTTRVSTAEEEGSSEPNISRKGSEKSQRQTGPIEFRAPDETEPTGNAEESDSQNKVDGKTTSDKVIPDESSSRKESKSASQMEAIEDSPNQGALQQDSEMAEDQNPGKLNESKTVDSQITGKESIQGEVIAEPARVADYPIDSTKTFAGVLDIDYRPNGYVKSVRVNVTVPTDRDLGLEVKKYWKAQGQAPVQIENGKLLNLADPSIRATVAENGQEINFRIDVTSKAIIQKLNSLKLDLDSISRVLNEIKDQYKLPDPSFFVPKTHSEAILIVRDKLDQDLKRLSSFRESLKIPNADLDRKIEELINNRTKFLEACEEFTGDIFVDRILFWENPNEDVTRMDEVALSLQVNWSLSGAHE